MVLKLEKHEENTLWANKQLNLSQYPFEVPNEKKVVARLESLSLN